MLITTPEPPSNPSPLASFFSQLRTRSGSNQISFPGGYLYTQSCMPLLKDCPVAVLFTRGAGMVGIVFGIEFVSPSGHTMVE